MKRKLGLLLQACAMALFVIGFSGRAVASGVGPLIADMADVPPETKIQMLRIIFEDVFGTPEEIKAQFVAACNARKPAAQSATSGVPGAASPKTKVPEAQKSISREATLAAFCAPTIRRGIESALTPKSSRP